MNRSTSEFGILDFLYITLLYTCFKLYSHLQEFNIMESETQVEQSYKK